MNYRVFHYSTPIIFGSGSLQILGTEINRLGINKVLLIADAFIVNSLVIDKVIFSLKKSAIKFLIYEQSESDPTAEACQKGLATAIHEKVEGIVAIGGGSTIDLGKAIAVLFTNGGSCTDWNRKNLQQPILPTICIPTTAGTGSEVTSVAVITDTKRKFKMSIGDPENLVPALAIVDPELTISLPPLLTAATAMDALTHAVEAYTCKAAQPTTNALALHAIEMIDTNLEIAVKNGRDMKARQALSIASTMAGMAFINANVGAVHALSETVGAIYGIPHGIANAVFLPYVMKFNLQGNEEKFAEIARHLNIDTFNRANRQLANLGIKKIMQMSNRIGIPKLKDISKISVNDFPKIAALSAENDLSDDNARRITASDYLQIIHQAYRDSFESKGANI